MAIGAVSPGEKQCNRRSRLGHDGPNHNNSSPVNPIQTYNNSAMTDESGELDPAMTTERDSHQSGQVRSTRCDRRGKAD
jgi:hypothetical protein